MSSHDTAVVAAQYSDGSLAELCLEILVRSKIEAWIMEQEASAMIRGGGRRYHVFVHSADASAAQALLESAEMDEAELPKELATPACPSCGASNTTSFLQEGTRGFLRLSDPVRHWMFGCYECDHEWPEEQSPEMDSQA